MGVLLVPIEIRKSGIKKRFWKRSKKSFKEVFQKLFHSVRTSLRISFKSFAYIKRKHQKKHGKTEGSKDVLGHTRTNAQLALKRPQEDSQKELDTGATAIMLRPC